MSRLSNHIDTLLAFHDCVVIPTFGAIIKEQIAPRYCREDRVIYPAKKLLHFNKELRERDFLLEELYAQNYGISRRRARILVDQDVADFVSVLHRTGHGSLTAIGHFQLIDNGAVDFTPEVSSARFSSGDSYGLIPYHIPVALQEIQVVNASLQTLPQERENTDYIHFRLHKKSSCMGCRCSYIGRLSSTGNLSTCGQLFYCRDFAHDPPSVYFYSLS